MTEPLSPTKKKIRPWLDYSFRKSMVAALFAFLGGMCWRAYHAEAITDPARHDTEIKALEAEANNVNQLADKLSSLKNAQERIKDVERSAWWLREYANGPALKVDYDAKWLRATTEETEKKLQEAAGQYEMHLIHTPDISVREFSRLAADFLKTQAPAGHLWRYREQVNSNDVDALPALRVCQAKVAAQGITHGEKSADAIFYCTQDGFDWRLMSQRTTMGGLLVLGFMGRRLRKKWDAAAAQDQTIAAGATPQAQSVPVVITTSQPVAMKPIKIKKAIA
jgi:hypothetical protein